jgi:hypothetical protein
MMSLKNFKIQNIDNQKPCRFSRAFDFGIRFSTLKQLPNAVINAFQRFALAPKDVIHAEESERN